MGPGLAWLPVALQREVFVNSARVGGYSSHSTSKAERAPILPRPFFFGITWGPGTPTPPPGKGEGQVHSHRWASGRGESWGRENDCL